MSDQRIDAAIADLKRRGLMGPNSSGYAPSVGLASADDATRAYAQDIAASPGPAPKPVPGVHGGEQDKFYPEGPEAYTPQKDLPAYADRLKDAPPGGWPTRAPVSIQVNEDIPEVAAQRAQQQAAASAASSPAPAGPTYVAPHFDPQNIPIRPETQKQILGTFDDVAQAQALKARAQVDEATVVANHLGAEADRAKQSMAMRMRAEDQRRQIMRQQVDRLNQVTQLASAKRVNENAIWEQKGTLGTIASAVGIALGAGVAAQTGGRNVAQDIVDSQIANNLAAQKANLALEQQGVENQSNLLGHLQRVFGDERLAELAFENMARENAIQQIQAEAAKRQAPQILANAAQAIAAIRQQQLQTQAEFERMSFVKGQLVGGGAGTPKQLEQERLVRTPDGKFIVARTSKEAQDLRQAAAILPLIQNNYNRAIEIREEPGWWLNPENHLELRAMQQETEPLISKMGDNSVLRDAEREDMRRGLTAFSSFTPGTSANLKKTVGRFTKRFNYAIESQAAPEAETGYTINAQGQRVPVGVYTGVDRLPKNREMPKGTKPMGGR